MSFQNSFKAAVQLLGSPAIRSMPTQSTKDHSHPLRTIAVREFRPQLGIMDTRPVYKKQESSNRTVWIKLLCQNYIKILISIQLLKILALILWILDLFRIIEHRYIISVLNIEAEHKNIWSTNEFSRNYLNLILTPDHVIQSNSPRRG